MAGTTLLAGARVNITGQSAELEKAMAKAAKAFDVQEKKMRRLQAQARRTNKAYAMLASQAKGIAAIGLGAVGLGSTISTIVKFEQSLADLSAITGATGKDLEYLSKASLRLGATSSYSANEVADAFKLVASAKPDLLANVKALDEVTGAVLKLAEASGIDLETAANAVGGTLNQFGLAASEAERVVNLLAAGSKFGAASVAEIAASMKEFGVTAATFGISVEESAAAIETLGSVAIKGSQAGVGLKSVLLSLETQAISRFKPSVVGLAKALDNLAEANLGATKLAKIFGKDQAGIALALIQNRDTLVDLTETMTGTNTAFEQAAIRTDTLGERTKALKSAWDGLILSIGNTQVWKDAIQSLTDFFNALSGAAAQERGLEHVQAQLANVREGIEKLEKARAMVRAGSERDLVLQQRLNVLRRQEIDLLKELAAIQTAPPAPAAAPSGGAGAGTDPDEPPAEPAKTKPPDQGRMSAEESYTEFIKQQIAIRYDSQIAAWEMERQAEEARTEYARSQAQVRSSILLEIAGQQIEAAGQAQEAWMTAAEGMVSSATQAFSAWISGTKSAEDAFRSFAEGVINSLLQIAQQAAASKLLGFLAGAFGGGGNSFLASGSGRVPVGFGARGGFFPAGRARVVGETGPELEFPAYQTRVVPFDKLAGAGGGGGQTIIVNGVQDPTAVRAEVIRLLPLIGQAEDARFYESMSYPNQRRSALRRGVQRG